MMVEVAIVIAGVVLVPVTPYVLQRTYERCRRWRTD